jgi:epoxyqueuosine reductase
VDTGPVLERELARRAGLGWFGRNTMLIDPRRGSYFFLGSLLLPIELEYDEPFDADRCGSCRACLDACPTGALLGRDVDGAPVMDARLCLSYLTIENRGPIPRELRPAIGNRIYGCDICQEVCPFNNKRFVQIAEESDYHPDWREAEDRPDVRSDLPSTESPSLVELMRMTMEEWDRWTRGSAIRRAGYAGLKRNVAVAMGNWLAAEAEPPEEALTVLRSALEDEDELVREHAAWALQQMGRL